MLACWVGFAKECKKGRLCGVGLLGRFLSMCANLCRGVKSKLGNWDWAGESEWYGGFGFC